MCGHRVKPHEAGQRAAGELQADLLPQLTQGREISESQAVLVGHLPLQGDPTCVRLK